MKVVVDANRVMSAIIKDSSTRRALLATESTLYAPDFMRGELAKHRPYILKKSGMPAEAYDRLLALLFDKIRWVPDTLVETHMDRASILRDPADRPYLAAALAVDADAIWSEDKGFDEQKLVPRTRDPDRIRT